MLDPKVLVTVRAAMLAARNDAKQLVNHAVPLILTQLANVPADKRPDAVVLIVDPADAAGRPFLEELRRFIHFEEPSDGICVTVQPLGGVLRLYEALGLYAPSPTLLSEPPSGAHRVLVIAAGAHQTFTWTPPVVSPGGSA